MLDATTKRKIDSARQILVGKVPDPKAQVEQITTALVYKFMDDMDKEAEELGGKAKFFTDDLKDFAWSKLLDTRYSGQERMDLYVRAISAFAKAKQLPQLFRDIFKDAFLPYRDPETLSLFLKEINNFTYGHSEDLGNAFEYLLSVLGSQGDAGQFRTPRHIIDFIVAVVDPKKNETVLDPACGTAGFLISAYKHIRKHNSSNFKPEKEKAEEKLPEGETIAETVLTEKTYRGDKLTPSERGKLMNNFVGYDISPDMVKLSLVNMYLHGFSDPKIYEYDTLTSEKHWGEQFDVIMANPPFMSPKGGIRPHKRFSVQASRSEVLFVNYILEHLALKGRAGIIVPEGIIFKTENAYKQLREMLIEDGLFAVVSLPPGVFNPYSGVKTSILLFDNELAKKSDEILFLKIENDGFDLGAQRRKIDKNDLPEALDILDAWKQGKKKESDIALWVKKEKIAESGDYNLTGERYKETEIRKNQKWPIVELKEVAKVDWGNTELTKKSYVENGEFLGVSAAGADGRMDHFEHEIGVTVLSAIGANCGRVFYPTEKFTAIKNTITFTPDRKKMEPKYLFYIMKTNTLPKRGGGQPFMSKGDVEKYKIPLPSLEIQKEIVEQIEVKQNAINHAKEIIKNLERERRYFGQELRKLEDVDFVELKEVMKLARGVTYTKSDEVKEGGHKILRANNISLGGKLVLDDIKQISTNVSLKNDQKLKEDDIFICLASGSKDHIGKVAFVESDTEYYFGGFMGVIRINKDKGLSKYIFHLLQSEDFNNYLRRAISGVNINNLNAKILGAYKIPLPPLEIQKQLVAETEKEEEIIASNRRLIDLMERKINQVLAEI
ncbi:MAG: N-6 DNA methylase [Patescibacteria group bacterium]|jgi:type I restriction enzyme M protein